MKKTLAFMLSVLMLFALAACAPAKTETCRDDDTSEGSKQAGDTEGKKFNFLRLNA